MIDIIKKLETRPDMCATIAATPILDEERKQKALRMMSVMSQKLLALAMRPTTPLLDRIDKAFELGADRYLLKVMLSPHELAKIIKEEINS